MQNIIATDKYILQNDYEGFKMTVYVDKLTNTSDYSDISNRIIELNSDYRINLKFDNFNDKKCTLQVAGLNRLRDTLKTTNIKSISLKNISLCTETLLSFFNIARENYGIKKLKLIPSSFLHAELDTKNVASDIADSGLTYLCLKVDMLLPEIIDGITENNELEYVDLSECTLVSNELSKQSLECIKNGLTSIQEFRAPKNFKEYDYLLDEPIRYANGTAPSGIKFLKQILKIFLNVVACLILVIFAMGFYLGERLGSE